jgi:hypothetical protein
MHTYKAIKAPLWLPAGNCGPGIGSCASPYCCSPGGWCGGSTAHCTNCQQAYSTPGKCLVPPPPTPDTLLTLPSFDRRTFVFTDKKMTHPLATDYCDRNYNASTLPIFHSKVEEDEFNPAWIRYTKQTTVGEVAGNWYWLAYQLEPGGGAGGWLAYACKVACPSLAVLVKGAV